VVAAAGLKNGDVRPPRVGAGRSEYAARPLSVLKRFGFAALAEDRRMRSCLTIPA